MKIVFFANSDWYLYNFRIALARYIRQLGLEVVMVSPPGEYVKLIEADGFRWISIEMRRRSTNPLTEIAVIKQLAKIFRQEKPDLVHNFTIKSVVYGSIAAKLSRVKYVVNAVAGLGFVFSNSSMQARILKPVVQRLLQFALDGSNSRLILQNPDDQALFSREKLVKSANTRLIKGSGVNMQQFQLRTHNDSNVKPVVLMASRLLWDKGVMEYVEAAKKIKASGHEASFLLAGLPDDGNPDSVTEADIVQWRKEGNVDPIGHVTDMAAMLKKSDIVVLPTRYGEGVPRVLIESAATGLPLVCTNVPGCREIVIHEENGFVIEPNDVDGLVEALKSLLDDQTLRNEMGKNGRELALREFDEEVVFKKTLNVYKELISI